MKKVLGMGNALVDVLILLDSDDMLHELGVAKGSMQHVDRRSVDKIFALAKEYKKHMVTGGSASNTISGLSKLGITSGFIGKIGKDDIGGFFQTDLRKNGVNPLLSLSDNKSGQCIVLISPDGERTMCTYLGAACELDENDLTPALFSEYDFFHIEGYLVQNHALIKKAVRLAKEAGLTVSIDLASFNIVENNLDFLHDIVSQYVDIVFANEEEAQAFTGKAAEEALIHISEHCDIAIVKVGKDGSHVKSASGTHKIAPILCNCIDSTGAGDSYAAGFLFGLTKNYSHETCGNIGSLIAGHVVEVIGAKLQEEKWEKIYTGLKTTVDCEDAKT